MSRRSSRRRSRAKGRALRPRTNTQVRTTPANGSDAEAEQRWQQLRSGARNVAGVTFQIAVTADLLVGGRAGREGHPSVGSVVPEGWEDVDCQLSPTGRVHVQAKERGPGSRAMGAAEVAEVIAHAGLPFIQSGGLQAARFALVTDGTLGSGLMFTGWSTPVTQVPQSAGAEGSTALETLRTALEEKLAASGQDTTLAQQLLSSTHLVHRPWDVSSETEQDLRTIYSLSPVAASLAYSVIVGVLASMAAKQRATSSSAPAVLSAADLDRVVSDLHAAIDVQSLEEAVRAGVCEPVDYLLESDLTAAEFFAGVDVSPAHISAGLDVLRVEELGHVLGGLNDRRQVAITGPSGSGKSALLWRAGRIVSRGARTIRVLRVANYDDVDLLLRHVRRERPSENSPLLVCADDLGRQSMAMWAEALPRLHEIPFVYILLAVRREDFTPALAGDGVVVDATLTPTSAVAIHEGLIDAGIPVALEPEEAILEANGLLMEYLALLTTGRRLREVLAAQVSALRSPERWLERRVLRMVCAAHTLGAAVNAVELGSFLSAEVGGDASRVGDALSTLEGEHLILHDALGNWRGLHDLRTDVLQELLHTTPPPTLAQTFAEILPLLPPAARPVALRRAAECLARAYAEHGPDDPERRLQELTSLLQSIAETAGPMLHAIDDSPPGVRLAASLLAAGERLDSVAYVYAVLPAIQASRPPSIDTANLGSLLYTVRNDGISMPDFGGGPAINALGATLPPRPATLARLVAQGLEATRLAELVEVASVEEAISLLEAAEGLVTLTPMEAQTIWEQFVPSLPSPPGAGFDLVAAERRAQLAAVLAQLADLRGAEVATALGPVEERAADAVASDPYGVSVTLSFEEATTSGTEDWLPAMARRSTWSPNRLLVAAAVLYAGRSEEPVSTYPPQPGAKPGPEEDARRACQRLLDACPEVDRADVRVVGPNGELPTAGGHSFGEKTIRSGVLRGGVPVRRNVAFQAAVARALAAGIWSGRLREQAEVSSVLIGLLADLPLRLRSTDNTRRRREWQERVRVLEGRIATLPSRPLQPEDPDDIIAVYAVPPDPGASDESAREKDRAKDVLSLIAGCLSQVAGGLDSLDSVALRGAGARLRDALGPLQDARGQGAPVFAAVGETLPLALNDLIVKSAVLLLAVGMNADTGRKVARSRTVEDIDGIVVQTTRRQADSDRQLVVQYLESAHVPIVDIIEVQDPRPLLGRLDGRRLIALVPVESWDACETALVSWDAHLRQEMNGHVIVIAIDAPDLLPIGLQLSATGETPLPLVEMNDLADIARAAGRNLRGGEVSALARKVVADLTEWSFAVTRRGTRNPSWAVPPLPVRDPTIAKRQALDTRDQIVSRYGSQAEIAIDALCELAGRVSMEDGIRPGIAWHLTNAAAGAASSEEDFALLNLAMGSALDADRLVSGSADDS